MYQFNKNVLRTQYMPGTRDKRSKKQNTTSRNVLSSRGQRQKNNYNTASGSYRSFTQHSFFPSSKLSLNFLELSIHTLLG